MMVSGPGSARSSATARAAASAGSRKRKFGPGEEIAGVSGVHSPTTATRCAPKRNTAWGASRPASSGSRAQSRFAQSGRPGAAAAKAPSAPGPRSNS